MTTSSGSERLKKETQLYRVEVFEFQRQRFLSLPLDMSPIPLVVLLAILIAALGLIVAFLRLEFQPHTSAQMRTRGTQVEFLLHDASLANTLECGDQIVLERLDARLEPLPFSVVEVRCNAQDKQLNVQCDWLIQADYRFNRKLMSHCRFRLAFPKQTYS